MFTRIFTTEAVKAAYMAGLGQYSVEKLSTDSVGTATVTFDGVHAGSEIRVYLPDGTEVAGIESCADDQALSWAYYTPGSANNTVTIRIVHLDYEILDFVYTTQQTAVQSIPVQQRPDGWYRNP